MLHRCHVPQVLESPWAYWRPHQGLGEALEDCFGDNQEKVIPQKPEVTIVYLKQTLGQHWTAPMQANNMVQQQLRSS